MIKHKRRTFAQRLITTIILFLVITFLPQVWLRIKYRALIHDRMETVPEAEYAIVFGAWVNDDHSLSDITRERVEAGIELYESQKVKRLFISGDNRSNKQAEEMVNYAVQNGVQPEDIFIDRLGIDTNDTCKHFAELAREGILVTQGYHLPRTMLMCESSGIKVTGLAVEHLGILESRGDHVFQVFTIRAWRIIRESVLTWMFILGIYDRLSTEAETLAKQGK